MAKLAGEIAAQTAAAAAHYEQPLSERMRTFLRLEFLYQQMLYNAAWRFSREAMSAARF